MTPRPIRPALFVAAAALAGCASAPTDVVFVTKTSFAVDLAATPASLSIGYDRVEGYLGPRFESGHVPPVAASFITNGKIFSRQVRQVYATGRAAEIVTLPANEAAPAPVARPGPGAPVPTDTLLFSTGTTIGLKLGFGASGMTDWLTFGYKRREASVIPVAAGEFPSVLATLETDQETAAADRAAFGVGQYFATGAAAQQVAADPEVRRLFRHRIESALGKAEREEKTQAESALSTLSCLAQLPDADLPRVFAHAGRLQLFERDSPGLAARLPTLAAAEARSTYTRYLAASDGDSSQRTTALAQHRALVCALAGR